MYISLVNAEFLLKLNSNYADTYNDVRRAPCLNIPNC